MWRFSAWLAKKNGFLLPVVCFTHFTVVRFTPSTRAAGTEFSPWKSAGTETREKSGRAGNAAFQDIIGGSMAGPRCPVVRFRYQRMDLAWRTDQYQTRPGNGCNGQALLPIKPDLAECCGLECVPHNWGTIFDHAVHFHCELASPNSPFFEMTQSTRTGESATTTVSYPYMKDSISVAEDGYVYAPTKPGLGYEIDRDKLEDMLTRVET